MDKALLTGAVATTGGCSIVQGRSMQEMILYLIVVLMVGIAWQMVLAVYHCREKRKRIELMEQRRLAHGKPV